MRISREASPTPTTENLGNIRLDISHAEGVILQKLMLEIQGIKGWCQRDSRVHALVTNLVVHLPAKAARPAARSPVNSTRRGRGGAEPATG